MALQALESYWAKKRFLKLGITIFIYLVYGDQLAALVESLNFGFNINPIAANIIVFGIIGASLWTLIAWIDNEPLPWQKKRKRK